MEETSLHKAFKSLRDPRINRRNPNLNALALSPLPKNHQFSIFTTNT